MAVDVAAENARTDGREPWADLTVSGHGDINAAGFARQVSVNVGETIQFSVDGASTVIDIYRAGYYGGGGFRKVATIANTPTTQPEATTIPGSNGATSCTGWAVTAEWAVPADATSGMYLALVRSVPPHAPNGFHIMFVVRDDAAEVDIIYKTSESTWGAAYNHYGTKSDINGRNIYGSGVGVGNIMDRSLAVSHHRPVITHGGVVQTYWTAAEMPLIRFLERNGYSVKYITGIDIDRNPDLLTKGKVFLSSGHDEYWSTPMRDAVENWRDQHAGRSIFMSGNEVFWRTRYEYNGDEAIMWCFKDTMPGPTGYSRSAGQAFDPVTWTGTWKDTRWPERRPEWLLTGTDFRMNGIRDDNATILRNPYAGHKVWGGSSLNDGDITLTRVVGFEADSLRPTQPAESVRVLAAYTRNIDGWRADDNGQTYSNNGNLEWGIVSQRYAGGGLTVGFGTVQWSWALDGTHDRGTGAEVDIAAQQFTVNLLRDLGADPATPMPGVALQPANSLDEYGLDPDGESPPPPGTSRPFDAAGNPLTMRALVGGRLVELAHRPAA